MKKLLLILLCLPLMTFAQQTYVPDNWFEAYLENNGMGNGIQYDDSVFTSAINTVTHLDVSFGAGQAIGIFDLTGIEDFTSLTYLKCSGNNLITLNLTNNILLDTLKCSHNQITNIDVTNNENLIYLDCNVNQLTSIDVTNNSHLGFLVTEANQISSLDLSQNSQLRYLEVESNLLTTLDVSSNILLETLMFGANQITNINLLNNVNLIGLYCSHNLLTSLDVSMNYSLERLFCHHNLLTTLDLGQNFSLIDLRCYSNQLMSLNVKNGNNSNFFAFTTLYNPNLTCINVDDSTYSVNNWTGSFPNFQFDFLHYFSTNCNATAIEEHSTNKELLRTTDVLGRETKGTKNEPLFYIYDDGTVEKKIIIE